MFCFVSFFQEALQELEELKQIVPKESLVYFLIGKVDNLLLYNRSLLLKVFFYGASIYTDHHLILLFNADFEWTTRSLKYTSIVWNQDS